MMITRLIIARHGNTFLANQTPRRIGARTDLPLVPSGELQAKRLGCFLKDNNVLPDQVFCSQLQRTRQTAELALATAAHLCPIISDSRFNEIDYGPDENQLEANVVARLGQSALTAWDEQAIVPPGWQVNPIVQQQAWLAFAACCQQQFKGKTILVVTSNGVARFSPVICRLPERKIVPHSLKISTGAVCWFEHHCDEREAGWHLIRWNEKPN